MPAKSNVCDRDSKKLVTFKFTPAFNHEMINEQSFRPAGVMDTIYSMQDHEYCSLQELTQMCRKLDTGFF